MKKITLYIITLLFSILSFSQVPQGISYQAIAMNGSGSPVVSSNVGIRLSVINNSATGTTLYEETHIKTTNAQGLFNLVIGTGTTTLGTFTTINWGLSSKFLKVEMDITGGTNYVTVGTTQLLSVPYALAADSLITSPGEGISLVSPNGTTYQLTVNDSGQLSLPTIPNNVSTLPSNLYMYGSFNGFNATSALLMDNTSPFSGYKYLTAGTTIKFLQSNTASAVPYGLGFSNFLNESGSPYTVPNNGFYLIKVVINATPTINLNDFQMSAQSITPTLQTVTNGINFNPTYNVGTNKFSFVVNSVTNTSPSANFKFLLPAIFGGEFILGDNLNDGTLETGGTQITFPNLTTTPKNFRVDLTVNFNGSATYTITQI